LDKNIRDEIMVFKQFSVYLKDLHAIYLLDTKYKFDFKPLKNPQLIVIHGTGDIPVTVNDYYTKSVEESGQPKTHFIINSKGTIYQTLPINMIGNHIQRRNEYSFGISLHNIITSKSATQAMKYSLIKLIDILKEEFSITEIKTHKELMVEDVLELMIELGLYPVGEDIHHSVDKYKNKEELDKIDVQKLLILNGKQLEEYKQYLIEYINDELDQSLYSSMLIDRIKKVSDCPGKYYSKLKINPLI